MIKKRILTILLMVLMVLPALAQKEQFNQVLPHCQLRPMRVREHWEMSVLLPKQMRTRSTGTLLSILSI